MPKFWRIVLTLSCLLALIVLLWRSPPKEFQRLLNEAATAQAYPESYLTGADIKQYSEQGQLSYRLQADAIFYYALSPSIADTASGPEVIIQKPTMTVFESEQNQPEWVLSSVMAEGSEQKDELLLKGDVLIRQVLDTEQNIRISTAELWVRPKRRYAQTDKPVMIIDNTGRVDAVGLKVYFDEKRIELLSNVKSVYQNPQNPQNPQNL
ncbi:MAG: LPS export ABC transporter periplasmic protein LptC [Pseudomonadota bacterium]